MKQSLGAKPVMYPNPVLVVGSYDADGGANAMTAARGAASPARSLRAYVSLRAATASHGNIMARQAFTISLPAVANAEQADCFGLVSGRDHDKFADLGVTAVRGDLVDAPYVGEFPIALECKVVGVHELGLHTQFIGEILDVKADESVLGPDGAIDLGLLNPILFAMGAQSYYAIGELVGKAYTIGKRSVPGDA
jgi:flavin reductase (DIM6/NTAB) family NADH-FMN oxidoreductase RutF